MGKKIASIVRHSSRAKSTIRVFVLLAVMAAAIGIVPVTGQAKTDDIRPAEVKIKIEGQPEVPIVAGQELFQGQKISQQRAGSTVSDEFCSLPSFEIIVEGNKLHSHSRVELNTTDNCMLVVTDIVFDNDVSAIADEIALRKAESAGSPPIQPPAIAGSANQSLFSEIRNMISPRSVQADHFTQYYGKSEFALVDNLLGNPLAGVRAEMDYWEDHNVGTPNLVGSGHDLNNWCHAFWVTNWEYSHCNPGTNSTGWSTSSVHNQGTGHFYQDNGIVQYWHHDQWTKFVGLTDGYYYVSSYFGLPGYPQIGPLGTHLNQESWHYEI